MICPLHTTPDGWIAGDLYCLPCLRRYREGGSAPLSSRPVRSARPWMGYDPAVVQDAVRRMRSGETATSVARAIGCSKFTASRWAKAAGVKLTPGCPLGITKQVEPSPERIRGEGLIRLGMSNSQVAVVVGVSREAVRKWRLAMGRAR